MTIMRVYPIIEGEIIEEDFFSYLIDSYKDYPVGTAVLVRKTNYSEHYYLFTDVKIVDGELITEQPESPGSARTASLSVTSTNGTGEVIAGFIGRQLAAGLVSGLASPIGVMIFQAVFGSSVPSYFDEVYKKIREIVKEELSTMQIDLVDERINSAQTWARNTYLPRKAMPGVEKNELYKMLDKYLNFINTDAIGNLKMPRLREPGLQVFMVAAGVHLALFQEKALVDPLTTDPKKSSYAVTIQLTAEDYANHAESTFNSIITTRRNAIKFHYLPAEVHPDFEVEERWWWNDEYNGEKSELFTKRSNQPPAEERARNSFNSYVKEVIDQLIKDLYYPLQTTEKWRMLIKNPIPKNT